MHICQKPVHVTVYTYDDSMLTCIAVNAQKEEPKPEMPAEPEATATGEQSTNGVPPEGASEPSKVDIEEVDPESSTPMDS